MTIVPFAVAWAFLVIAVILLAAYRRMTALHEDDYLHVSEGEAQAIPKQVALASKLEVLDRWGKILTIVSVATGVVLGLIYLYQLWNRSMQPVA